MLFMALAYKLNGYSFYACRTTHGLQIEGREWPADRVRANPDGVWAEAVAAFPYATREDFDDVRERYLYQLDKLAEGWPGYLL